MNVLIIGGGGREHALAWAVTRSPIARRVVCAPGNAGTARLVENVTLRAAHGPGVVAYCRSEDIGLVLIGPEAPLVAGVADHLRAEGVAVFGPGADGARLEGSKVWAKELMLAEGVPTARSATVRSVAEAAKALEWLGGRVAVKADGLAAGKGVVMCESRDEAVAAVGAAVEARVFGDAGRRVLIEEWLEGEEASVTCLVDGEEIRPLAPSQDHKRAHDGDRGPNTGGMGAYAPFPRLDDEAHQAVVDKCVRPVAHGLAKRGVDFRGVLYAGLMLTEEGPRVLEYNVRFGDPEAQVILPLAGSGLLPTLEACARGELAGAPPLEPNEGTALAVVAASAGYPASSDPGRVISGIDPDDDRGRALVFHAGTKRQDDGTVVTAGGRVLAVTGLGVTLAEARNAAYDTLGEIRFEGMFMRNDIGARGLDPAAASKGASR
jgi:phosphoribosylamine--glycine ligase